MEDRHATRREQILTESLETSNEPRWGYFGIPGSLAIGDNSYAPSLTRKPPPADDSGEPIRNIGVMPLKKGSGTDVYFKFETPLALGDPFVDPGSHMRKGKVTMLDPEAAFKPPGRARHSTNKLGYEYVEHKDTVKDPKELYSKYKDYMPPRQVYTNSSKKGGGGVLTKGVLFGLSEERLFPEYKEDDYEAPKKQRLKELEEHRSKCPEQAFKSNDYGNKHFQHNTDVYSYEVPTHVPREPKPDTTTKLAHETPFRPSNNQRRGFKDASFSLHSYIEDPLPGGAKRKPPAEGEPPPPYRLGNPRAFHNPTHSVVTMTRNMRSERPASFARPVL